LASGLGPLPFPWAFRFPKAKAKAEAGGRRRESNLWPLALGLSLGPSGFPKAKAKAEAGGRRAEEPNCRKKLHLDLLKLA
jgi:hypothetical protein